MFFNKKKSAGQACIKCGTENSKKHNFCHSCGASMLSPEKELKEYGLLGRSDLNSQEQDPLSDNLGFFDKMMNSMMESLVKTLDKQMRMTPMNMERAEVQTTPNGIRIKIGPQMVQQPQQNAHKTKTQKRQITEEQISRMSTLPRVKAPGKVKRLSDRVVYEMTTPGVNTTDDVFISKLENGYEIKAIGTKKIYVNSFPLNLPLRRLVITKNKLSVEFHPEEPRNQFEGF